VTEMTNDEPTVDEQAENARLMATIMTVPEGFLADVSDMGLYPPSGNEANDTSVGWYLYTAQSDDPIHIIGERPDGMEREAVALLMRDPAVYEVKLWRGLEVVWAAVRDAA